ncbi:phospholipid carrier-dependent glycosyltransferase [Pseudarthrobacter sp. J75]|uniref:dolichyl-phosphate-mannose--protein mannosyltransferase n=1 Tax=unclassified Pseudarthrobacter TaxID=2647000 RepID=UPI002E819B03|nr:MULTISPECIES: phospholipid carrier-dependent glycosyltransferase [unclassified Pseudarthrobacter]MEE2521645.1 phospholipid carrier-dependent glycosyltransferase [Pseudarthrobacter sp. J47]MEE2527722.1 phospholipid carrier-dependent glycosyltransferase [Pseudarthrobacter sp. J75]
MTQTSDTRAGARRADGSGPASDWLLDPRTAFSRESLLRRLSGRIADWREYPPALRLWYWLAPVLTAVVAGILRFVRLGEPNSLVFDETYYVKDGYSYLMSGYERNWPEKANDAFNAGNPGVLLDTGEYVVHPPVGKWMIAGGMWLFGADNAFGWRFAAALTGTLSVLLVALIAQKLFSSTTLGAVAGLLLAVDGHHLVLSRTSLLDIFLMFWVLAAFGALLLDRDDGRRRLAERLARQGLTSRSGIPTPLQLLSGPWLGIRWWRIIAGVCLGLAVGTKWSALFFLAAFGLLTVFWDLSARRVAGVRGWITGSVIKDGIAAFLSMVPVAALVYTASWTGWFRSTGAYYRNWAQANPSEEWGWLPDTLRSWFHYHLEAYNFHQGLGSDHPYEATAWTWLVMGRPTSFFYQSPEEGTPGCTLSNCTSAILSVGNPLIWWAAALSLVVLLFWWAGRRDWRAGAILAGMAGGYLPWFMYPERTTFFFYAISFEPFLILALTYCIGLVLGGSDAPAWRRRSGLYLVAIYLAGVLLLSAFFYPVWTAEIISYQDWRLRIWMPSWI